MRTKATSRVLLVTALTVAGLGPMMNQARAQSIMLTPETLLISRIRGHMRDVLLAQPDYTCMETVERTRESPGGGPEVEDTLRLEVALVGSREMFAWPGSDEFEDTEVRDLVTTGMFGNGNFALYAEMLFLGYGPKFEHQGETEIRDRKVVRYDFTVPRESSGYTLRMDDRKEVAGYHGSIYADAETLDLVRLEFHADDIPPELGLTAAEDRVDYDQVAIGEDTFLLPVESRLMMSSPNSVARNRVRFSSCRKFQGESQLVFLDPDFAGLEEEAEPVREVEIPKGIRLGMILTSEIDLRSSAIGDAAEAELDRAIERDGEVIVPKGAIASGRIVRLDRTAGYYILGIRFTDLEWPGSHARVTPVFEQFGLSRNPLNGGNEIRYDTRGLEGYMFIQRPGTQRLQNVLTFWRTI